MGSFLDKPITEKDVDEDEGNGIKWGYASMQGWRVEMEDAHLHVASLEEMGSPEAGFFGVFDGHGGKLVSTHVAAHLLDVLGSTSAWKAGDKKQAIHEAYMTIDDQMKSLPAVVSGEDKSGTTAITAMVLPDRVIFANSGDSRAVYSREGKCLFGTKDHKPTDEDEERRIVDAGGTVSMRRVDGDLAVSRALGDYTYKQRDDLPAKDQKVSPEPVISVVERDDEKDDFLIIACDGIWDVMENQDAIDFVFQLMREGEHSLSRICEDMLDECLDKGSKDNMSAIIVTFPNNLRNMSEKKVRPRRVKEDIHSQQDI
jgi:protein phosphatase 1B